jgi:cytochrome c oxidase assembly factor CtaG
MKLIDKYLPYWWMIRPVSGLMRRRLLLRIRNAADRYCFIVK